MISRIWHGWTKPEHAERAVIRQPARRILTKFDERSVHYETVLTPADVRRLAADHSRDGDATGG